MKRDAPADRVAVIGATLIQLARQLEELDEPDCARSAIFLRDRVWLAWSEAELAQRQLDLEGELATLELEEPTS